MSDIVAWFRVYLLFYAMQSTMYTVSVPTVLVKFNVSGYNGSSVNHLMLGIRGAEGLFASDFLDKALVQLCFLAIIQVRRSLFMLLGPSIM